MINTVLAREIYTTPWHIGPNELSYFKSIRESFTNGSGSYDGEKNNQVKILETKTGQICSVMDPEMNMLTSNSISSNGNLASEIEGIGIISIDGPITLNGGASSYGMLEVAEVMRQMSAMPNISSFILLMNSGGGSSMAVNVMGEAIKETRLTKDVVGLVSKGGTMASAMFGIGSFCSAIYAEDEMSIVGSAGTMIQFDGYAANSVGEDGLKRIRVYATASTRKNEAFEEALNNDNYTLLVNELLNPINEMFLESIQKNRPQMSSDLLDGRTMFAGKAVGTFIDGIKSFSEVVNELQNGSTRPVETIIKSNTKMTEEEFKLANPSGYAKIASDNEAKGVAKEQERVAVWGAYRKVDSEATMNGILSNEPISALQKEELLIKAAGFNHQQTIAQASAPASVPAPVNNAPSGLTEAETKAKEDQDLELKNALAVATGNYNPK